MKTGKQLTETAFLYPCDGYKPWSYRVMYIRDKRYGLCPNCDARFEFPVGIEVEKNVGCSKCGTVFQYEPKIGLWYYLPSDFVFSRDVCPDCDRESPEADTIPGFRMCRTCNLEFRWELSPLNNGLICFQFPYGRGKYIMMRDAMNEKYKTPDPFGVKTDPADAFRKNRILDITEEILRNWCGLERFARALDIGCGEGFITVDFPATEIWGYDVSDVALERFPSGGGTRGGHVLLTSDPDKITGMFDLILAAGVMVREYDFKSIIKLIEDHACGIVVICQTDQTEVPEVTSLTGNQIHCTKFPYREFHQRLRVFSYYRQIDHPHEESESDAEC